MNFMNINSILVSLLVSLVLLFLILNLTPENKYRYIILLSIIIIGVLYCVYLYLIYKRYRNKTNKKTENFYSAPIKYKMSKRDGLTAEELMTRSFDNLESHELPNVDKVIHVSPVGGESPLKLPYDKNKVSVDGTENSPKSLFMFSYNKSDVNCCDSQYSNSVGCICLTDKQKQVLRRE